MTIVDDRTKEQRATHNWIVAMTDSFMSGWGRAKNGTSYAGWACRGEHLEKVEAWVNSRTDAKRVRIVFGSWRPRGEGHCHIYVADTGHPAIGSEA